MQLRNKRRLHSRNHTPLSAFSRITIPTKTRPQNIVSFLRFVQRRLLFIYVLHFFHKLRLLFQWLPAVPVSIPLHVVRHVADVVDTTTVPFSAQS
jgi:hypothetical protein